MAVHGRNLLLRMVFIAAIVMALILGTALPGTCLHEKDHRARILVLNSYNQGSEWTDDQMAGIRAGFKEAGRHPNFFIEYLDAKRHTDSEYLDLMERGYSGCHHETRRSG